MSWIHVCTISEFDQIASFDFRIELLRGEGIDQLRSTCVDPGINHSTTRECPSTIGSDRDAALAAIAYAIEAGFIHPQDDPEPGLLTAEDVQGLVDAYFAKRKEVQDAARARPSDIVATAEHLGLKPYPTGSDEVSWRARCPGTKHEIQIQSSTELFYCGYCGVSGGPLDLEDVVADRSEPKKARAARPAPTGLEELEAAMCALPWDGANVSHVASAARLCDTAEGVLQAWWLWNRDGSGNPPAFIRETQPHRMYEFVTRARDLAEQVDFVDYLVTFEQQLGHLATTIPGAVPALASHLAAAHFAAAADLLRGQVAEADDDSIRADLAEELVNVVEARAKALGAW